jgi:hypothetical protein
MNKILTSIGLIVVLAIGGAYLYFSGKEYVIYITELQIKEKISEKLPRTKTYLLFFETTLDNPRIELENESNRINGGLDINIGVNVDGEDRKFGGSLDISGGLRYVTGVGDFYLTNPIIENISVQGVPDKYEAPVLKVLTTAISEHFEKNPVYSLRSLDPKQAAAKIILKSIVVKDKQIIVTMGI